MKKIIAGAIAMFFAMMPIANADQALIIDAGYSKEYKVVSSNRLGVKTDIYKNMSLELGAGIDKGSEYTGVVGTAGVKWKF